MVLRAGEKNPRIRMTFLSPPSNPFDFRKAVRAALARLPVSGLLAPESSTNSCTVSLIQVGSIAIISSGSFPTFLQNLYSQLR